MAETNLKTRIVLRNDSKNNWEAVKATAILLKGEIGIEFDPNPVSGQTAVPKIRMKVGDGITTWENLPYFGGTEAKIYQIDVAAGADHQAAIAEAVGTNEKNTGDIAIVKELINASGTGIAEHRQYTAYVYDGSLETPAWIAMDGNYSAENVFFKNDLTYTKAIGELDPVPSTGSATLAATGKSVKDIFATILAKRAQPSITQPAVTLKGMQTDEDVEIGTNISKSGTFTSSLSAGAYTYGPATGVTASSWSGEIKYTQGKSGSIATVSSGSTDYTYSFQLGTDGDTVKVNFKNTATHNEGAVAKDNLGDDSNPVKKIAAGTKSNESTVTYTSYRKMFYGTFTNKETMTSDRIRTLTGIKQQAKASNSLDVTIPVGALRVAIAVPPGRSVTSIKDRNGLGAEIFSSFGTETVNVEGANGYTALSYTVYYMDYADPNDKVNHYDVTVA